MSKTDNTSNFSLEEACCSNKFLQNLRGVIQSHPDNTAKNFGMSVLHMIESEFDEMLSCLESLIEDNPTNSILHRRMAEVFIQKNNFKQAIIYLEKAVELDKENLTAKIWLCLSYFKVGCKSKGNIILEKLKDSIFLLNATDSNWL